MNKQKSNICFFVYLVYTKKGDKNGFGKFKLTRIKRNSKRKEN